MRVIKMAFISEERINLFRTHFRRCACSSSQRWSSRVSQSSCWRHYSNAGDNFHQKAIALQRQQNALQVQQNRIVNQNKNKLPQPRVPICVGNSHGLSQFHSGLRELDRISHPWRYRKALQPWTTGDVKEQVLSCYYLSPEEGCDEACTLLN